LLLPAHIISCTGVDDEILPNDLSLRDSKHLKFINMDYHVTYRATLFMENQAAIHPDQLSLIYYYLSLVMQNKFPNGLLPKCYKLTWRFTVVPFFGHLPFF